jgi:biopolymer transport protein ExbD
MQVRRRKYDDVEMQMGPMIDMVFLLLVFFMVTAKPVTPEADVGMSLPGSVSQEESVDLPDEQQIEITSEGFVVLNDLKMAEPGDKEMPVLFTTLKRFKETAEANRNEALITIAAADHSTHQRLVDVLNVCARAEITGVSFADTGFGEEEF